MLIRPKPILTYSSGVLAIAFLIAGLCQTFLNRNRDNEVTTFYFTVHTRMLSYEEVEADYGTAAARLQAEFSKALGGRATTSGNGRRKRETKTDGPKVTVIGISDNDSDGISVLSGVAYPRPTAPSKYEFTQRISIIPNTVVVQIFSAGHGDPAVPTETFCFPTVTGTPSTTRTPDELTSCPSCPVPECPPQTSCPPCSSSPLPTASSGLPCKVDIGLILSATREAGQANFNKEVEFVHHDLASKWSINPEATEVNFIAYGSAGFYPSDHGYEYPNNTAFYEDIDKLYDRRLLARESIQIAIKDAAMDKEKRREGVKHVVVLFVYHTSQEDVDSAVGGANDVIADGSSLIFIGVGPLVDLEMLNALHGFIIGTDVLDDITAEKINTAICATASPPTFQYPSDWSRPTLATTTLATNFGHLPCQADIVIAMEKSHVLRYEEFDEEVLFVRDKVVPHWTISINETQVLPFGYGRKDFSWYRNDFTYPNNGEVFTDLTKIKEEELFSNPDFGMAISVAANMLTKVRPNSVFVTLAFTYTSALPDAWLAYAQLPFLKEPGRKFVIVAIGNNYNETVLREFSSNLIKATEYTDALADQISEELCKDVSPPPPSSTLSTPSTTPTTSVTTESSTSEQPQGPMCTSNGVPYKVDISLYVGASLEAEWNSFQEQLEFIHHRLASNWSINPLTTEVEIAAYGEYLKTGFSPSAYKYARNEDFYNDIDSLSTSKLLDGESLSTALMYASFD
uniref:VWFA domain-containing protein n=2 Tax=Parascaris univalens TaxID=6257 RepID=A0A915BR73_PARUN